MVKSFGPISGQIPPRHTKLDKPVGKEHAQKAD
jgi:hypothetical protein